MKEINVRLKEDPEFEKALRYAKALASKLGDPTLLSFYDAKTGRRSPNIEGCGDRPWESYAINRGANLKVKINQFEFFFIV